MEKCKKLRWLAIKDRLRILGLYVGVWPRRCKQQQTVLDSAPSFAKIFLVYTPSSGDILPTELYEGTVEPRISYY